MKISQLALLFLPAWALAYTEADYDSGKVHQMIMDRKHVCWHQSLEQTRTNQCSGILGEAQKGR